MSEQRDEFAYLGQHARSGGPLQPPFDEATTASDVAIAIHAALDDVGLSAKAICRVGCALISVSRSTERSSDASTAQEARGGER
jgi:hypothetical protein